jgi:hypothetical protein
MHVDAFGHADREQTHAVVGDLADVDEQRRLGQLEDSLSEARDIRCRSDECFLAGAVVVDSDDQSPPR